MFPLTPFRYLIGGLLSNTLGRKELGCPAEQAQYVTPPAGQSCQQYLGPYIEAATGQLLNPNAVGENCGYCQYASGDEYLSTLQASYSERWRNLGIVMGYVVFNLACVFALTWLFRVHKWTGKSKASNKKGMKEAAPQQVQQQIAKTEGAVQGESSAVTTAFNPVPPGTMQTEGTTTTDNETDRRKNERGGDNMV